MTDPVFAVNQPRVISERIEGEVIMIDLVTGSYYSLNPVGAEIWAGFTAPTTLSQVTEAIVDRYANGNREDVASAVREFLDRLQAAELIVPAPDAEPASAPPLPNGSTPDGARPPFEAPALTAYTDMQDLLLLDPVHEVDEGGWPYALPKEPTQDESAPNPG